MHSVLCVSQQHESGKHIRRQPIGEEEDILARLLQLSMHCHVFENAGEKMKQIYTLVIMALLIVGSANAQFYTVMDFDAPNITGSGVLGDYNSPSTVGGQVKAAYPMISYWDDDFELEDTDPAYYGTGPAPNYVDFMNALRFDDDESYMDFGPLPAGNISFSALHISGENDAEFKVRIYASNPRIGNPSPISSTGDIDVTYTTGATGNYGINYYPGPADPALSVPANGYVRICSEDDDDFYIDGLASTGGAMPVELTSFRSYLKNDQVELQWTTATELNNYGFDVERSANGDDWSTLGFVAGHGTCFTPQQYAFRDARLDRSATELYYRLRQMDRDGTTEYSDVLRVALVTPTSVKLSAYPQPFAGSLNIDLSAAGSEQVHVTLYNSAMQKVQSIYEGTVDGTMSMTVPATDLRDGSYFLIVNHANGQTQVQKLLHMQSR
jgi:hypothetical protein